MPFYHETNVCMALNFGLFPSSLKTGESHAAVPCVGICKYVPVHIFIRLAIAVTTH